MSLSACSRVLRRRDGGVALVAGLVAAACAAAMLAWTTPGRNVTARIVPGTQQDAALTLPAATGVAAMPRDSVAPAPRDSVAPAPRDSVATA